MRVGCSQCSTEYEFEDVLVSAKGTSVKCSQCGHQFRVFAPRSADNADDTWVVRLQAGEERVFTSLRDLQQAIVRGQLLPEDSLARGRGPFRSLGGMPELHPFLAEATRGRSTLPPSQQPSLGPASVRSSSTPLPSGGGEVASTTQYASRARVGVRTLPPPLSIEAHRPYADDSPEADRCLGSGAGTGEQALPGSLGFAVAGGAATAPAPAARPRKGRGVWVGLLLAAGIVVLGAQFGPTLLSVFTARGPSESATQVRSLLARARVQLEAGRLEEATVELAKASALSPGLPHSEILWASLERARAERLWLSREALRALAEAEPQARRLHEVEMQRVTRQLDTRLDKLEEALRGAEFAKRRDSELTGARIDLSRMRGELAVARRHALDWSGPLPAQASAFVLAALDYAAAVVPEGAAGRLSGGASSAALRLRELPPHGPRPESRALAVLALHRAGDPLAASRELRLLEKHVPEYPLVARLELLVRPQGEARTAEPADLPGAEPVAATEGDSGSASDAGLAADSPLEVDSASAGKLAAATHSAVPVGALSAAAEPLPPTKPARRSAQARPSVGRPASAQRSRAPRPPKAQRSKRGSRAKQASALARAEELHRAGELTEAEQAYSLLLRARPDSIPVLLRLGSLERQRKQPEKARSYYERVLAVEPGNVVAIGSLADMSWFARERGVAVAQYRRVLARAGPESRLGQRALRRIEQYERQQPRAQP